MELVNYAVSPSSQERLLPVGTYGPILEDVSAKATPEQAKFIVTHPDNIKDAVIQNDAEVSAYVIKYEDEWQKFQLG
jgi:hypothetical protein